MILTLSTWFDRWMLKPQANLEKQMSDLEARSADRRRNLEGSKKFHEFMRESWDLEHWISDQMQMATSEDYGQDFEHLQVRSPSVQRF